MTAAPAWLAGLGRGERTSLARAITAVENDTAECAAVLAEIRPRLGRALVVGLTGAPGAGKSTLADALVGELRRRGRTVGVVAVDPSSPLTGGALLGDRIRMRSHAEDDGVFVRSLASRGHLGGLSRTAGRVIDVMDAAGRDVVLVETVGVGQSEVEVAHVADLRLYVAAPGLGDEIQAIKAGVLEIVDLLIVNKADHPLAERTARELARAAALAARAGAPPAVLKTVATRGEGIAALADAITGHAEAAGRRHEPAARRLALAAALAGELRRRLGRDHATADRLAAAFDAGEIDAADAIRRLFAAPDKET